MAEAMKSTEPSMLSQAIRHGNDCGCTPKNRCETASTANALDTRKSIDP